MKRGSIMSNKLEEISKLVDNQTVNSSTLEQLIKDRLNDVGPENYYEAIRLLKIFYYNPILVPEPIPVTNTRYHPYMAVRLRIEFQDHPDYPEETNASLSFYLQRTLNEINKEKDLERKMELYSRYIGRIRIFADGTVKLDYPKHDLLDKNDPDFRLTDSFNIWKLTTIKSLWDNARPAEIIERLLNNLIQ